MSAAGSAKQWIQGVGGVKWDLLHPDASAITIERIAWHLAHLCRYTGAVSRFYTVAEHSVWVSRRAAQLFDAYRGFDFNPDERAVERRRVAQWGLLHDATEAFLGDVSRPLKHLPGMGGYRKLEQFWESVLQCRFHLRGEPPPEVAAADAELLGTEADQLMQPIHPDWGLTCPGGKLPDPIPGHPRLATAPWFFGARRARRKFLKEFRRLFPAFLEGA